MKALNYVVIVKESHIENITASGIDITSESDKNEKYRKERFLDPYFSTEMFGLQRDSGGFPAGLSIVCHCGMRL